MATTDRLMQRISESDKTDQQNFRIVDVLRTAEQLCVHNSLSIMTNKGPIKVNRNTSHFPADVIVHFI